MSAHDLRRTYANAAISAGVHTVVIKAMLNHAVPQGDVTVGCAYKVPWSENDLREPVQRVADCLKKWCGIK